MAQAPFATSGNVADIAPVQLRGGFTPNAGLAEAVVNVANTIIPVIRQNLEDDITEDVTGRTKAVGLALKAIRFPSIQESIFSEEALANPNVAMALEEFTLIQDAAKQGRLPATFALERLELIQNNAIRNAPEFEQEIRGALRDATGLDPQKALFGKLLSETVTKTAEQKAFEQLDIESIKLGVTRDQLIGMNQAAALNRIEQDSFDLSAKQGTYTIRTLGSEVINRGAALVTDVMADVQRMNTSGIPISVEDKQALISKVNAAFGASTSAILAKTAGLNVSGTAVSAELAPLNTLRDNVVKMIEDDTLQNVMSQHNQTIIASTQNSLLNNPDYVTAYAIGGSRGFLDLVKFMGKSSTAEGKALTAALSGDARIAFDLQNLPKQYSKIGSSDQLETVKEKQDRVIAAGVAMGTSDIDENFQIAALEDIKKYGGEELAWSSFGSNQVLTATAKSNKLKAAFINMQATTTAGLSQELVELASDPNVQLERLVLTDAGLTVTPRSQAERVGLAQTAAASDASMATYARRFNRANGISAKYNGAGILPSARYQGSDMYWNTVREAATDIVQPREDAPVEVIKFVRGADGTIVLATEGVPVPLRRE